MITLDDIRQKNDSFHAYMEDVDRRLRDANVPIPGRPLNAFSEIAKDGIQLLMFGPFPTPEADNINAWFERKYGKRLNMDFLIGKVVLLIEGDPYLMRLPVIYGQCRIDVPSLIEGMTEARFHMLSNEEASLAVEHFGRFHACFNNISRLPPEITVNIDTAILQILAQNPHYGESKWASLQTVEKCLKAWIDKKGGSYPFVHDLSRLLQIAQQNGLQEVKDSHVKIVQCAPAVRYEDGISLRDAVAAHHQAILISAAVAEQWPS